MTGPGTEEASEDERAQHERRHEQEAGSHHAQLERVHHFVELERRQGAPGDHPVRDVHADQQVDRDEAERPPPAEPHRLRMISHWADGPLSSSRTSSSEITAGEKTRRGVTSTRELHAAIE